MAEQGGGNRVREQEKGGKESYNTTDWDDLSDKMGRKQSHKRRWATCF